MGHDEEEIAVLSVAKGNNGFLESLDKMIRVALRVLALLMTLVIFWGVADVAYILYHRLMKAPQFLLTINDIFATFSGFMAVLIAIEIYTNIVIYLKDNFIHVRIVMATALMAIARKVIVLDFSALDSSYLIGIGAVMLATGVTYWLTFRIPRFKFFEKSQSPAEIAAEKAAEEAAEKEEREEEKEAEGIAKKAAKDDADSKA